MGGATEGGDALLLSAGYRRSIRAMRRHLASPAVVVLLLLALANLLMMHAGRADRQRIKMVARQIAANSKLLSNTAGAATAATTAARHDGGRGGRPSTSGSSTAAAATTVQHPAVTGLAPSSWPSPLATRGHGPEDTIVAPGVPAPTTSTPPNTSTTTVAAQPVHAAAAAAAAAGAQPLALSDTLPATGRLPQQPSTEACGQGTNLVSALDLPGAKERCPQDNWHVWANGIATCSAYDQQIGQIRQPTLPEYERINLHAAAEEEVLVRALSRTQPGDTFVDGGAGMGYYAILVSALKPDMKVVAFSPSEWQRNKLGLHARHNLLPSVPAAAAAAAGAAAEADHQRASAGRGATICVEPRALGAADGHHAGYITGEDSAHVTETTEQPSSDALPPDEMTDVTEVGSVSLKSWLQRWSAGQQQPAKPVWMVMLDINGGEVCSSCTRLVFSCTKPPPPPPNRLSALCHQVQTRRKPP
jgi:hypothetical protein